MRKHKQLASPLLNHAEVLPHELAPRLTLKRKSALGQFMTPASLARFMASLFSDSTLQTCHLLDAGAGIGALSARLPRALGSQGRSRISECGAGGLRDRSDI